MKYIGLFMQVHELVITWGYSFYTIVSFYLCYRKKSHKITRLNLKFIAKVTFTSESKFITQAIHCQCWSSLIVILDCVQLYMYQLFRSLAYIHSLGICHRDIKPQNLLLDPETGVLKLCDFGSAKHLVKGEPNVSYICSRYYRAPELIFGAIDYTTKIGELVNHLCTDRGEDLTTSWSS